VEEISSGCGDAVTFMAVFGNKTNNLYEETELRLYKNISYTEPLH
jgi:hypothetical protein